MVRGVGTMAVVLMCATFTSASHGRQIIAGPRETETTTATIRRIDTKESIKEQRQWQN